MRDAVVRPQADRLGAAKSAATIMRGLLSRHKTVRAEGMGRGGGGQAAWRRRPPPIFARHSHERDLTRINSFGKLTLFVAGMITNREIEMFQPERDHIPSQYDLMPPILEAIYQSVGTSPEGVHYTVIDEYVTEWITDVMPSVPVDYTTPTGSRPLLEMRLASARSLLYREGLIQRCNVPGRTRGYWALTPKASDLDGGSGAGRSVRPKGPPSSGSGSQSLVPNRTQGLTRSDEWDAWAIVERTMSPDGNAVERTTVE